MSPPSRRSAVPGATLGPGWSVFVEVRTRPTRPHCGSSSSSMNNSWPWRRIPPRCCCCTRSAGAVCISPVCRITVIVMHALDNIRVTQGRSNHTRGASVNSVMRLCLCRNVVDRSEFVRKDSRVVHGTYRITGMLLVNSLNVASVCRAMM